MKIGIQYLETYDLENWGELKFAHEGDSGFDLYSTEDIIIFPKRSGKVGTGIKVDLPKNYEIQIRPRSGLAFKNDVICNFGTIDSPYRGEIGIKLFNLHFENTIKIKRGDRIAQAVISYVPSVELIKIDAVSETERGENGFGSTGI